VPSTRDRRRRRPDPDPTIFVDRDLGRKALPNALRERGYSVVTLFEVYGEEAEQGTKDPEWIKDCAANGWIALCRDRLRHKGERPLIEKHGTKVFRVAAKARTGPEQIQFVINNIHRIMQRARWPGPFIDRVEEHRVERVWPPKRKKYQTER
jgi:PIN like domain